MTPRSRLLATQGIGLAMLLGMERDGLLRIVPDEAPEPPQKKPTPEEAGRVYRDRIEKAKRPWGSTKYQQARMRQAAKARAGKDTA